MASDLLWTMRGLVVLSTLILLLIPAPATYRALRDKSVSHMAIFPLAAGFASSHMWILHGYIRHNIFPAVTTFIVGDTLTISYILVFLYYTTERAHALKVVGTTMLILAAASAFAFTEKNDNVIGPMAGIAALILYGWPFGRMQRVLEHKSSEFIPVTVVARLTFNNVMWVVYTVLDGNWFTFAPHAICLPVGIVQLALYWHHRPGLSARKDGTSETAVHVDDEQKSNVGASSSRRLSVVIVGETPTPGLAPVKAFPESPSFQLLHSPLEPLHLQI
ncbi:hypothetical protein PybrP1_009155 [[Pythium] brassicae (nom. inval.)]|nr:hypothetical protein PybrP1_009155 [[Pythium] brassicae (nom. inval.)]